MNESAASLEPAELTPFFGPGGVGVSVTPVVQANEASAWLTGTHCRANTAGAINAHVKLTQ